MQSTHRLRERASQFLSQRTVRLRLTLLYGALFVVSGACLLVIVYVLILRYSPTLFFAAESGTGPSSTPITGSTQLGQPPERAQAGGSSVVHWTGLSHMLIVSGIALAIMAVISIIVGWFVAGRMLRPLRTMTVTARRISERNLHERLALQGPSDELKDLGDTIDDLLGRIEAVVNAQRQFAANASHELRTPLTLERTLLESVLTHPHPTPELWRSTCERVLESNQKQARLIDALLVLARSQQDLAQRACFDLASVATGVVHALETDATAQGLTIDTALEMSLVTGDIRLVERLVFNLVQNAIRYNVPHGRVGVIASATAGQGRLRVTNTGSPIAADQIDRLLQPFQRLGAQRAGDHDGLGLGLSIVVAIASAHRATIAARPRPEGGLDIEVTFPHQPSTGDMLNDARAPVQPAACTQPTLRGT
jgi:signal transduction histidine kinase